MAFTSPMTAVTGATFTAADFNTHVRDNLNAIWVGTTAGDTDYYTASTAKSRLAIGGAGALMYATGSAPAWLALGASGKFLKSTGSALAWDAAANVAATYHNNATAYTYNTNAWRDMPNSSKIVTLTATSTIVCIGVIENHATDSPSYYGFADFKFNIDGTDIDWAVSTRRYGSTESTDSIIGLKADVAAGNRTIKIREICRAGEYYVLYKHFIILVIS